MQPNRDQIEKAAYVRWQRRGARHGRDVEDWTAAEKDITFALNYRWIARFPLGVPASVGKAEAGRPARCRFCEQAEPAASFSPRPLDLPAEFEGGSLVVRDECEDCRAAHEASLGDAFASFSRPFLVPEPQLPTAGSTVPVAALKALVRIGLCLAPAAELQHFGDTFEWVANPDHARDAAPSLQAGLGCQVYVTPEPISSAFVSLARRTRDDGAWPYMLAFLGAGRVVFATHFPFCPRDEDLEDACVRGPVLSMSMGQGNALRASLTAFLPVAVRREVPLSSAHAPSRVKAAASRNE